MYLIPTWEFVLKMYTDESSPSFNNTHDDVIKWKHFPRSWLFVRGIYRSPVNYPHKGQWRGTLMFSLICTWINGWVNNREVGDLRRHRAHYDVTVMQKHISQKHGMGLNECIKHMCEDFKSNIKRKGICFYLWKLIQDRAQIISLNQMSTNVTCFEMYLTRYRWLLQWPLLLTWFNFNLSMDK